MTKKYFSQRTGRASNDNSLSNFASKFYIIFCDFAEEGYFKGVRILHENTSLTYGVSIDGLERELVFAFGAKSSRMLPNRINIMHLDRDSLFDLIEFLSEQVSVPGIECYVDKHGRKDYEPDMFFKDGWEKWRDTLNKHLVQLDPPCRLTTDRNIETLPTSKGLQYLVDNHKSPSANDQGKVRYACELFLKHNATKDDRRSALKNLADVLESMQRDLKKLIPKEKNDLFNIANNYGIRHHNNREKECDENYQQWIFYSFLAAIDLMTKLKAREL